MSELEEVRDLACDIAMGAGQILLEMRGIIAGTKSSPTDLVTDADRTSEAYIVDRIRTARPDDSILGEEGAAHEGTSGVRWVIDPLDGTVNYVYEIPQWCVSIGIEGALRAGVVYDPKRDELFTDIGWRRSGGELEPYSPSPKTDLSTCLVGTGFSYSSQVRATQSELLTSVLPLVRDVRRAGSCALDLCWVACGRLDAFYEHNTHHWDISAGLAALAGAGAAAETHEDLTIAAGNPALLAALKDLLGI